MCLVRWNLFSFSSMCQIWWTEKELLCVSDKKGPVTWYKTIRSPNDEDFCFWENLGQYFFQSTSRNQSVRIASSKVEADWLISFLKFSLKQGQKYHKFDESALSSFFLDPSYLSRIGPSLIETRTSIRALIETSCLPVDSDKNGLLNR